jgi:hypothetical protein
MGKDAKRKVLYEQLQLMVGGHPVDTAVEALADSFVAGIGQIAKDLPEGEQLIDSFASAMKRTLRDNWAYFVEVRAASGGTGRA